MADFDPATGTLIVPWWGSIALLAVFVALTVVAILRAGGMRIVSILTQVAALAILVAGGWTILDRMDQRERADERRAFDARVADLAARAMAPGSALGCLDPMMTDALDEACEKAIFNNPEAVAGATAYVAARVSLLADAIELEKSNPGNLEQTVTELRRVIERDRYGIVAHVFAVREGCNVDQCAAFALLRDPARIVTNLRSQEFESRIAKVNATASTRQAQTPAATPAGASLAATTPSANGAALVFPSASTIPPVSIMSNEPGASGQNGMDEKADAKPAAPKRQAEKPAEKPGEKPAPRRAQSPVPIAPPRADATARAP